MNIVNKEKIIEKIQNPGIIPVIRIDSTEKIFPLLNALIAGGITCAELTMTIPNAIEILSGCREKFDGKIFIGMGTITTKEQAEEAIAAGAQFLVSPVLAFEALELARMHEIPFIMGAFSPSEIYRAEKAGADYIKIFPINVFGSQYIKDLKGPFPWLKIIPTGGITIDQVNGLVNAGAVGLGVGGNLVCSQSIKNGDWGVIVQKAKQFVEEIKRVKYETRAGNKSSSVE